jgi:hypothetical protein
MLLCQRVGCSARYTEETNVPDGCRHHSGLPSFRDGVKAWSCCGARSHDFASFMELPGCCTGRHTQEKPVTPQAAPATTAPELQPASATAPAPSSPPAPAGAPTAAAAGGRADTQLGTCARCRQGFFCAEHASSAGPPATIGPAPVPKVHGERDWRSLVSRSLRTSSPQGCAERTNGRACRSGGRPGRDADVPALRLREQV